MAANQSKDTPALEERSLGATALDVTTGVLLARAVSIAAELGLADLVGRAPQGARPS